MSLKVRARGGGIGFVRDAVKKIMHNNKKTNNNTMILTPLRFLQYQTMLEYYFNPNGMVGTLGNPANFVDLLAS